MQIIRIRTSQNIDIDYEVAGLGDRVLGRIIDIGVFTGLFYVIYIIVIFFFIGALADMKQGDSFPVALIVVGVIYFLAFVFYDLVAEIFFNGQSVGKFAMKIRVISLTGTRPTVSQYLIRWVFRLLDFTITFGIGAFISVAVSEKKQRIGDVIAGTTLIKTKPRAQLNELYFISPNDTYEPLFPQVGNLTDKDITLMHEVIATFKRTGNSQVVFELALRVKEYLGITANPPGMNDFDLLQTIVKDYGYITSRAGVTF